MRHGFVLSQAAPRSHDSVVSKVSSWNRAKRLVREDEGIQLGERERNSVGKREKYPRNARDDHLIRRMLTEARFPRRSSAILAVRSVIGSFFSRE